VFLQCIPDTLTCKCSELTRPGADVGGQMEWGMMKREELELDRWEGQ